MHFQVIFYKKKRTLYLRCRVLDIMKRDAQKDPADYPDALLAKTLINQVWTLSLLPPNILVVLQGMLEICLCIFAFISYVGAKSIYLFKFSCYCWVWRVSFLSLLVTYSVIYWLIVRFLYHICAFELYSPKSQEN